MVAMRLRNTAHLDNIEKPPPKKQRAVVV